MKFDFKGVYFDPYALCDAIYTYFKITLNLVYKTKTVFEGKLFLKCGLRNSQNNNSFVPIS